MASWEPDYEAFTDDDWLRLERDRFANGETMYDPLREEERVSLSPGYCECGAHVLGTPCYYPKGA